MTLDERHIQDTHATWIGAVNAGDLAALLGLMTEDAVFLNPGQAPFGKDGFAENFPTADQRVHEGLHIHCNSELEEVVVVGEVAYTRSRDTLLVTRSGAEGAKHFAGHRITVYRQQRDGRWLLARDAHTLSPVEHF